MNDRLALLDYRRMVAEMYARVRSGRLGEPACCLQFRRERDALFGNHPQSALSPQQQTRFTGLSYYPYDPGFRFVVPVERVADTPPAEVHLSEDGPVRLQRSGRVRFPVAGQEITLTLFWILGYGGGLFLPFRDATNKDETYEGGRYLLDTIKGADLGQDGGRLILDFNYAYNPSCAYDPRWDCPLAPPENWLSVPIRAGERRFA
ncbi:MAG: DUF1684 domain-containing protein [Armatimonadota bacterium]|nr:DUF1684 domain-containing protein [Armatimonadota bacterium]MDR7550454.1 DUF1684 domain-containing protein [Armatimonadota bacterium]